MAASRAAARAFIALLVIVLVGCSTSGGTPGAATTGTPSATTAGTPDETSPANPSSAATGPLSWERVVVSDEDWTVTALAVGDDQVLALVSGELSSIWASAVGHEWRQVHEFAADEYPADITSTDDGYVVVGFVGEVRTQRVMVARRRCQLSGPRPMARPGSVILWSPDRR